MPTIKLGSVRLELLEVADVPLVLETVAFPLPLLHEDSAPETQYEGEPGRGRVVKDGETLVQLLLDPFVSP